MIVYRTLFPLDKTASIEDFSNEVKNWLLKSPHYSKKLIREAFEESSWMALNDSATLQRVSFKDEQKESLAFQIINNDSNKVWTTSIVATSIDSQTVFSCNTSLEFKIPERSFVQPKAPIIVSNILSKKLCGKDGMLQLSNKPHMLSAHDIDKTAKILKGEGSNLLPVIYVSVTFAGKQPFHVGKLAEKVAGLAHVLVEPDRAFSNRLRISTNGQNSFGGAIGIYWPKGIGKDVFYRDFHSDHDTFLESIHKKCLQALTQSSLPPYVNFNNISAEANRKRILTFAQKQESKTNSHTSELEKDIKEYEEILKIYEDESNALKKNIAELEDDNHRLNDKLTYFTQLMKTSSKESGLLSLGNFSQLYSGEILSYLSRILEKEKESLSRGSRTSKRQRDILDNLVSENPDNNKRLTEIIEIVDQAMSEFKSSNSLTSKAKNLLQNAGFTITEEGKHYKITIGVDQTYSLTMPKTPSDPRSIDNLRSQILNTFFTFK